MEKPVTCRDYIPFFDDMLETREAWIKFLEKTNVLAAQSVAMVLSFMTSTHSIRGETRRCRKVLELKIVILRILSEKLRILMRGREARLNDYLHKLIEQHHGTNFEIYSLDNDPEFVPLTVLF